MASGSTARTERALRLRAQAAAGQSTRVSLAGWTRIVVRTLTLVLLLVALVPLHYLYRLFAYGSPFPKLFLKLAARICGARVRMLGTHLKRDVFYISNHVSWLDILALSGSSGTAFVAKAEVAETPVVGWLARLNRTVFVKREARFDVAAQVNALKEALSDNWSVTIFPEGTTTDGHSLLPFKTSMMSVLEPPPPGVLVQPVLLDYGAVAEEIGWVGDETGLNNAKRVLARPGSFPVEVTYLEPFSPEDYRGRKAIGAEARQRIEAALVAALGKPLREFAHDVGPVRYTAKKEQPEGPLTDTLSRLRAELAECQDDWWIIGSGAVWLHGAETSAIADVDVLVSKRDFERLAARLPLDREQRGGDELFASTAFGRWSELPLAVEFMTGLKVRQADGWRAVDPSTRVGVERAGQPAFAPAADELIAILESFARPKDLERAQALRKV